MQRSIASDQFNILKTEIISPFGKIPYEIVLVGPVANHWEKLQYVF